MVLRDIWNWITAGFRKITNIFSKRGVKPFMALIAGGYCFFRAIKHMAREITASELRVLIENKVVQRAISIGGMVYFRGTEGPWFSCNINAFNPTSILDSISQNPAAQITIVEGDDLAVLFSLGKQNLN